MGTFLRSAQYFTIAVSDNTDIANMLILRKVNEHASILSFSDLSLSNQPTNSIYCKDVNFRSRGEHISQPFLPAFNPFLPLSFPHLNSLPSFLFLPFSFHTLSSYRGLEDYCHSLKIRDFRL